MSYVCSQKNVWNFLTRTLTIIININNFQLAKLFASTAQWLCPQACTADLFVQRECECADILIIPVCV